MMGLIEIETQRLKLRQWKKEDRPLFAKINADPEVMQFYPSVLDEKESEDLAEKIELLIKEKGWGFWAVEVKNENKFIGFVGLHEPEYDLPITPCTEIGWRLAKEYWGIGYATEAAKACLEVAFIELGLSEVYSFTPTSNKKSQAVMERLGMVNTNNNFDHPMVPENSSLSEHLLYKIDKQEWEYIYLNVRN
ncbi:GNAT family N-acetyltransferase [Kaarinaea lacus]